ncbi:MAG: YggS family pyridoxal phosphate-dependent enzyme [Candidatus Acidulodesulfobacterium sp.]
MINIPISDNINSINEKIKNAALKSGRNFSDITLLAASKTRTADEIIEAARSGIKVFGENYVQEFLPKFETLKYLSQNKEIVWHIIGRLQKNKVKYIIGKVDLIHSVDDLELAEVIEKHSAAKNITSNILIEVNLAGEKTKGGILPEKLTGLISEINKFQHIKVSGLMTMPPLENGSRKYFKQLKELSDEINSKSVYKQKLSVLSMGTSGDFEAAIEEGATIIRLGTVIFGIRPPKLKK